MWVAEVYGPSIASEPVLVTPGIVTLKKPLAPAILSCPHSKNEMVNFTKKLEVKGPFQVCIPDCPTLRLTQAGTLNRSTTTPFLIKGVALILRHTFNQSLVVILYLNKERARFARSLLAPVSKHISHNIASSTYQVS